ncbi:hypothetical protein Scep_003261 [Stephania cephalantha]|uniref:1,4-alpha-glucan branching enzyme n=1 Tax=Stephania cephalantha TaxID=152367 RepID=A0AAP0KQ58_9MAGN
MASSLSGINLPSLSNVRSSSVSSFNGGRIPSWNLSFYTKRSFSQSLFPVCGVSVDELNWKLKTVLIELQLQGRPPRPREISRSLIRKGQSGKIFTAKSTYDSDSSSSLTVASSEKALVPGGKTDVSSSSIGSLESPEAALEETQVFEEATGISMEDDSVAEGEEISIPSGLSSIEEQVINEVEYVPSEILGDEAMFVSLEASEMPQVLHTGSGRLELRALLDALNSFKDSASLIGDFNNWNPNADVMTRNDFGVWEIFLPNNADGSPPIPHGSRVKIHMDTASGYKDSIPAWTKFSVQAPGEIPYNAIYYDPPEEEKYEFQHPQPKRPKSLRIYEAHVGMSSPEPKINTYASFRDDVLPRIKKLGYNAVQLMAVQEHSYYASFGSVSSCSCLFLHITPFRTPEDLKSLIDKAHELGLLVLMDIVHSHASNNVLDGLNMFDGTDSHYFHSGTRGYHWMWDSRLFNYGSWEVLRFLLSNVRWWLDEYKFDGFRFDGVTSMMYTHHGLQVAFTGNYNEYFGFATDVDAVVYLMLANDLIHGLFPEAVTVGEDVSGMPTFCIPVEDGGVGFDYRLHMAIADKWIEILKKRDEDWKMGDIVHTLTNRRWLEKCVSYAESHDQALVGDKTIAFWLMDKDMYDFMALDRPSTPLIDRGIALHKMIRLITMSLGGEGYLNFMGNEFGHPEMYVPCRMMFFERIAYDDVEIALNSEVYLIIEVFPSGFTEWIDFPRCEQHLPNGVVVPGNNNSFDKCRRRFDLGDADFLRYHGMQEFDQAMQHVEEKYGVVLNSDDKLFGGFGRIDPEAEYFSSEGWYDDRPRSFLVYAPARTAVVYALMD